MRKFSNIKTVVLIILIYIITACGTSYQTKTDKSGNKKMYNISYGDDRDQKMDIFIPAKIEDSTFVMVVHGGAWAIGKKWHIRSVQNFLLKNGIPSANIDYRLVKDGITYKDQVSDLGKATRYVLDSLSLSKSIVILGESSGGHIAMLYGYNNPDIVDKIITFAGPADLYSKRYEDTKLYKQYTSATFAKIVGKGGESFDSIKSDLKEASPISQVSNVPTLTFQGNLDFLVNKEQSFALDSVLTSKGIPHELILLKGASHTPRFLPWWRKNIIQPKILEFIRTDFSEGD